MAGVSEDFSKSSEALQHIEKLTSNAREIQQKVLSEILRQNAQTEYLQRFYMGNATDSETFKSRVPIISYDDIKVDIQRIANGDTSPILTAKPILEFFISSGTSAGEKKLIPITEQDWSRRVRNHSLPMSVLESFVPDLNQGKGLYFRFVLYEAKTQGGLITRNVFTKLFKSDAFRKHNSDLDVKITSPPEAILCTDLFQSMYIQMLCGLYNRQQVNRIGSTFVSGVLRAIRFLQLNWKDLTHDIRTGTLNEKITDPSLQQAMSQILKPSPELADLIIMECSNGDWEGIIPKLWPNAKFIDSIMTGTMSQYLPMVGYYSGGLQMVSPIYGSSECEFGINLNPICEPSNVSYTIMPDTAYFEFIPHEPNSSVSPCKTVDLVDVELGKEYEILVTSYSGLYRYQVGDILRVVGFHNSTPKFQIVRRKNVLISIDADKTDEIELQKGIDNASKILGDVMIKVMDYTSYASIEEIPGHYVIYLELFQNEWESINYPSDDHDRVLQECCLAIENSLSTVYKKLRQMNSIEALEIRVLKSGTFQELMEDAIAKGASASQYKVPRCIKVKSAIELLDSRVVSTHFSQSVPCQTT